MSTPIRMIAVDLDGTLLNSRKRISDVDAEALRAAAERGVEIVPVTGRNYSTALPMVADLLTSGPLISSNGAIIRSKTGETFQRGLLPVGVAAAVLQATREYRAYTVLTFDQPGHGQFRIEGSRNGDGQAGSPLDGVAASPWVERYAASVRFTESLEEELDGDPIEIMFAGPVALMREVAERLENGKSLIRAVPPCGISERAEHSGDEPPFRLLRTEYPERDFAIMYVIHRDCSKGRAVEAWSRFRGIPRDQILAIGDNYNDLDMLRFAGVPVVMGNSEEALKQEGWPVTLDCDSGGVARAVQRYVLQAPGFRC